MLMLPCEQASLLNILWRKEQKKYKLPKRTTELWPEMTPIKYQHNSYNIPPKKKQCILVQTAVILHPR